MEPDFQGLSLLAHVAAIVADRPCFLSFPSPLEVKIEGQNINLGGAKRRRSVRAAKISFKKAVDGSLMPSMIGKKRKPETDLEWANIGDGSVAAMPYCPKLPRSSASRFASSHHLKIYKSDSRAESIIPPRSTSGDAFEAAVPNYLELSPVVSSTIQPLCPSGLKLILQKRLTHSDMDKKLGRLLLPSGQLLREDFLDLEEGKKLDNGGNITVSIIEPCLNVSTLSLRKWKMSSSVFMLNAGWNKTAHNPQNRLMEDDVIQVWSFRAQGKLGLAIVKVIIGPSSGSTGPSSPSSTMTQS